MKTAHPIICLVPVYDPGEHTLSLHVMTAYGSSADAHSMPQFEAFQKENAKRVIRTNIPCPLEDVPWIKMIAPTLEILPEDMTRMQLNRDTSRVQGSVR